MMLKLLIFVFFLAIVQSKPTKNNGPHHQAPTPPPRDPIIFHHSHTFQASPQNARDPVANQLLEYQTTVTKQSTLLTSFGTPVDSLTSVLTAGRTGPVLLQDTIFIDHMAHFDRERIAERVVHARGRGAKGCFVVEHDITQYTKADVFSEIGKVTPVAVRFSEVIGSAGSPETVRDPRGFAIKFYTQQGIWDLVANNLPVFFIRDAMLFPSFIHSQKKNPVTNCPDYTAAFDFLTLRPESTHMVMLLYSDKGIPNGSRHMDGFGVHTFKLVNKDGKAVYCKFHLRTEQGLEYLTPEEARKIAGIDPEYETRDLYNAIKTGNFPKWKLSIQVDGLIQVMTIEEAEASPFNPFDATKTWSESEYPLIPVGELVLNTNPTNFFADVEQIAFCPSSMPPGIEPSPDKLLQGRLFSYKDTQRYRLGPNFMQIPVNMPLFNVTNYQRDGPMAIFNQDGAPNYFPNSFPSPTESLDGKILPFPVSGEADRYDTGDEDNFSQPTALWNSFSAEEQVRLVNNLAGDLSKAAGFIQERAVKNFCQVDKTMGDMLSSALALNVLC